MDAKDQIIQALLKENVLLKERIMELERRLGMNSNNSSKPPSSDGFKKLLKTKSLRETGKNPSGGQKGHCGETLRQAAQPDKIVCHTLHRCPHCQSILEEEVLGIRKRQVFDIPPIKIEVTEHQAEIKKCPHCNKEVQAKFPQGIVSPTQYGERIKAQAIYLNNQHYIPEDRLQMVFEDLYGVKIATATLSKFNNDLFDNLVQFEANLLDGIKASAVKNLDETGFRIKATTQWLHVASNDKLTYYHVSPKRKSLIDGIKGIVIHDHWKPYYQLPKVEHGLCNAHHLRELQALIENEPEEKWAKKMRKYLLFLCRYRHRFAEVIPMEKLERMEKIYDRIVAEGLSYHIIKHEELRRACWFGRKRYPGHNLLLRLKKYREDVLRFLHDPRVSFTNNQAERDLRMMKLRQKISGCFRTEQGAKVFVRIRSFLSTIRKQELDIFPTILKAVTGDVPSISSG